MNGKNAGLLIFLTAIVLGIFSSSSLAAESDIDFRMAAVEAQLKEQKEQTQQILTLLQSMAAEKREQAPAPATPGISGKGQGVPGEAKPIVDMSQLTPGWVAKIYPLDKGYDLANGLPATDIGKFVAKKSEYALTEYQEYIPFGLSNQSILWQGTAYLQVKEPGNHVFTLSMAKFAYGVMFVEGVEIGRGLCDSTREITTLGSAELEPGIYKIEFWVAGLVDRSGKASGRICGGFGCASFKMAVKRPGDDIPVPISTVFLVKK